MVQTVDLLAYISDVLEVEKFRDYCPNGLQVEGKKQVKKLVTGVTASQALIDAAIEAGADAILVHHGYFWKGEEACIVGLKHRRIKSLISHDINLLAYHLPLDAHPVMGNNACLAERLGLQVAGHFGESEPHIGMYGTLASPMSASEFAAHIAARLQREPLWLAGGEEKIHTIAWCSGAAQGYIEQAAELGVDAFLSGEVSEQTYHQAREYGLHYYGAGHHATERYGVQALGEHLAENFELDHQFIEILNPV